MEPAVSIVHNGFLNSLYLKCLGYSIHYWTPSTADSHSDNMKRLICMTVQTVTVPFSWHFTPHRRTMPRTRERMQISKQKHVHSLNILFTFTLLANRAGSILIYRLIVFLRPPSLSKKTKPMINPHRLAVCLSQLYHPPSLCQPPPLDTNLRSLSNQAFRTPSRTNTHLTDTQSCLAIDHFSWSWGDSMLYFLECFLCPSLLVESQYLNLYNGELDHIGIDFSPRWHARTKIEMNRPTYDSIFRPQFQFLQGAKSSK